MFFEGANGTFGGIDMMAESCVIAARCLILALAVVGMVPCQQPLEEFCHFLIRRGPGSDLDTGAKCRRSGSGGLLGCRIGDNGSDCLLDQHRSRLLHGAPRMRDWLGHHKSVPLFRAVQEAFC